MSKEAISASGAAGQYAYRHDTGQQTLSKAQAKFLQQKLVEQGLWPGNAEAIERLVVNFDPSDRHLIAQGYLSTDDTGKIDDPDENSQRAFFVIKAEAKAVEK